MTRVNSEHGVHLFDDAESMAETVGEFLFNGWRRGQTLLVIARPENWTLVSRHLEAMGCPLAKATASGHLIVLDAATTTAGFLRNGRPVPERFAGTVGQLVARLSVDARGPLRIYGEMVDVLAAQDEFVAVQELERMWNELCALHSINLLCGYASGHFGDPRTARLLRDICEAHDHSSAKRADLLAFWLLSDRGARAQVPAL